MNAAAAADPGRAEVLVLSGELTIYQAAELKQELLQRLDAADGLELDLSSVSEIDSSFVQLLFLARQRAAAAHKHFGLRTCSAAVADTFALLGLSGSFTHDEGSQPLPAVAGPAGAA